MDKNYINVNEQKFLQYNKHPIFYNNSLFIYLLKEKNFNIIQKEIENVRKNINNEINVNFIREKRIENLEKLRNLDNMEKYLEILILKKF